jgi:hypothetical protein
MIERNPLLMKQNWNSVIRTWELLRSIESGRVNSVAPQTISEGSLMVCAKRLIKAGFHEPNDHYHFDIEIAMATKDDLALFIISAPDLGAFGRELYRNEGKNRVVWRFNSGDDHAGFIAHLEDFVPDFHVAIIWDTSNGRWSGLYHHSDTDTLWAARKALLVDDRGDELGTVR